MYEDAHGKKLSLGDKVVTIGSDGEPDGLDHGKVICLGTGDRLGCVKVMWAVANEAYWDMASEMLRSN